MEIIEERGRRGEFISKTYRSGVIYLGCKIYKITTEGVEIQSCLKFLPAKTVRVSEAQFDYYLDAVREFKGSLGDLQDNLSKISAKSRKRYWNRNEGKLCKKKWANAHPEIVKNCYKKWFDNNRERYYAYQRAYCRKKKLERAQDLARGMEK